MPDISSNNDRHIDRYDNGQIKAQGPMQNGALHGYWEWFRRDGSRLRSGHFDHGRPVGEWTTYDRAGQVYKVTRRQGK